MNLKKIAGMCKSAGSFHVTNVVNDGGEVTDQWVILGPAAYRVDNMGAHRQYAGTVRRHQGRPAGQLFSPGREPGGGRLDAGLSQTAQGYGSHPGNPGPDC